MGPNETCVTLLHQLGTVSKINRRHTSQIQDRPVASIRRVYWLTVIFHTALPRTQEKDRIKDILLLCRKAIRYMDDRRKKIPTALSSSLTGHSSKRTIAALTLCSRLWTNFTNSKQPQTAQTQLNNFAYIIILISSSCNDIRTRVTNFLVWRYHLSQSICLQFCLLSNIWTTYGFQNKSPIYQPKWCPKQPVKLTCRHVHATYTSIQSL